MGDVFIFWLLYTRRNNKQTNWTACHWLWNATRIHACTVSFCMIFIGWVENQWKSEFDFSRPLPLRSCREEKKKNKGALREDAAAILWWTGRLIDSRFSFSFFRSVKKKINLLLHIIRIFDEKIKWKQS